ncbi:hypothetical protein RHSIM_Rhsim09G0190700 [Rhododendron simsii]|uniref:G domain-containing protein n=1 Tax=Rhododendron simsii TaxID=118357 RepID=A0A834LCM1_RHOSS|nr:hypothetical protein RHSIM_Rhsim09G0190700 [Rhododendron simsii]
MLHLDSDKMYILVLIKESEMILKLEVLNIIHKADDLTGQIVQQQVYADLWGLRLLFGDMEEEAIRFDEVSAAVEIKKSITVGVIGLPNVGKSSLINSLKRCQVVNVGATPGLTRVTRSMQEVHLDKNIKLLDCPGVVMLRSGENEASVALRNCKKIEKLEDPMGPVKEILKLCPARVLVTLYKLPSFD